MLADGTTAVRSVPRGFGISRLRRQLFEEYTISCVLERRRIFGRLPLRVKSDVFKARQSLPVYPQLRTCRCAALSDVMCEERPLDLLCWSRARRGGSFEMTA